MTTVSSFNRGESLCICSTDMSSLLKCGTPSYTLRSTAVSKTAEICDCMELTFSLGVGGAHVVMEVDNKQEKNKIG